MSPSAARAREARRGDRAERHPEEADGQVQQAERVVQPGHGARLVGGEDAADEDVDLDGRETRPWPAP